NLLINSMQAMPEGGDITLRLGSEVRGSAQYAVIDVADTGSGIPDAVRERVFDSFLTGRPDGTGLGLAIAKRILQGHNGDISLVSSSPAGTTLQITLPLARRLAGGHSSSSTFQYAMSRKSFQISRCRVPSTMEMTGLHFGRAGLRMSRIPASWGRRLDLRVLHLTQEQTMFSHVSLPP